MQNPNQPARESDLTHAARDVLNERERQQTVEDYSLEDDDGHDESELACAATWYALPDHLRKWFDTNDVNLWPFEWTMFKPKDRRRDLVRAAALILAEIERLDRAAATPTEKA